MALLTGGCFNVGQMVRDGFAVPSAVGQYMAAHDEWPSKPEQLRGLPVDRGEPFDPDRYHIALYPRPDGTLEVAFAARREHACPAAASGRFLMGKTADGMTIQALQPMTGD
jgi:hypothetical protein